MAPVSSAIAANAAAPTTTSLQDMSAAAAAIALDMKPKVELGVGVGIGGVVAALPVPTQKIKKLVRRNASDKLKLIQMVHDNPILWDSRLPNFKGAEEEKNRAWEHIGREFNAPGRRVARAFKSLRESYRRELAHVKLMGNSGFKPKWSLYEAMDFLRDVIRERKGGSHAGEGLASGLSLSAFTQHLQHNNNNNNHNSSKNALKHSFSSLNDSAVLNLSKCSNSSSLGHEDYPYFVKPELDLSTGGSNGGLGSGSSSGSPPPQPLPAHQQQQQQQQQLQLQHQNHNDSRVSSTRNDSAVHQHTSFEDMDESSLRSGDEEEANGGDASDEVEELEAIDADFPYPLILASNSPRSVCNGSAGAAGEAGLRKRRRKLDDEEQDGVDGAEGDEYEDQMLQQHRHLRQQQNAAAAAGAGGGLDLPPPQTVREVLNSKFCGFISAKLNSMEDSEADNLMNRILLLLVQMQQCEGGK